MKVAKFGDNICLQFVVSEFIIACVGIGVLAILYEGLKVWRQYMLTARSKSPLVIVNQQPNGTCISEVSHQANSKMNCGCCMHVVQTVLHVIQIFVGYMLMLAFMTYNTWMCVSLLIGSGIGYVIFGWITPMAYHNVEVGGGGHCNAK